MLERRILFRLSVLNLKVRYPKAQSAMLTKPFSRLKSSWQHFTTRRKDALLFALAASGAGDGQNKDTIVQL